MKFEHYIKPMLASIGEKAFDDADWVFEIKYDGYRAIAELDKKTVKLYSRNGLDFSKDYPAIFEALKKPRIKAVLDGEIVAFDAHGKSSFQMLQQLGKGKASPTLVYYVFDILSFNGKDLTELPLLERKERLKKILPKNELICYSDHVEVEGKAFYKLIVKKDMEGMIAKRVDGEYLPGKRSSSWLKIKYHKEQEVIIAGYTAPKGERRYFGSLLLAVYDKGKIRYVGHAGTGFNELTLHSLFMKMKPLARKKSPFTEDVHANGPVTWLKPELVCQIKFTEWTHDKQMRHPVFLGLRKDKPAKEVVYEF